jgi:serine protease Do
MVVVGLVSLALSVQALGEAPKKQGFLGVQIRKGEKDDHVLIAAVIPDSPAEKAGLRSGDMMVSIGGVRPATLRAAVDYIKSLKPKQKIKIRYKREGKEKEVEVTIGTLDS